MQYSGPGRAAREEEGEISAQMLRPDGRAVLQEAEGGRWVRAPEDKGRSSWGWAGEAGSGQTMQSLLVLWEISEGE